MTKYAHQISQYVDTHQTEMISFWEELVNQQAGSRECAKVAQLLTDVMRRFESEGLECRLIPTGCEVPALLAIEGSERSGKPILLCGHLDTVFPSDAYPDSPFYIEDGIAYGPGVLDMKGGVAMMLAIVKALRDIGFEDRPIKILLCGDEEIGHAVSDVPEIIRRESMGCLCAFNMESGRMDNCLAVGRKGGLDCHVTVRGKSGHVGNDFLAGRNAIEEMAHKILALQALTRYDDGVVVSVDVVQGGTVSNAIPDLCKIEIDARYSHAKDYPEIVEQIKQVCAVTYIEGTQTTVEFPSSMPVFERTEQNLVLLKSVNHSALQLGFAPFGEVFPGGNSDASYIYEAGIPVVCACGVQGSGAHTMQEQAIVDTFFQRTKIIALAITQLEETIFRQ